MPGPFSEFRGRTPIGTRVVAHERLRTAAPRAPEDLETVARAEPVVDDEADGRRRRGNRTRESTLQAAADLASVDGLEGLTIGRLATELDMSKSGLFAQFGSRRSR